VQSTGSIALTGNLSLQGTKEKGIDDYTGCYTADYQSNCFISSRKPKYFCSTLRNLQSAVNRQILTRFTLYGLSGADEAVTLIETTGTYSDTITLPEGGNYIGIECEKSQNTFAVPSETSRVQSIDKSLPASRFMEVPPNKYCCTQERKVIPVKKIVLSLCLILCGVSILSGCTKDV